MIVTAADLAINVAMDIVQQYEARAPDVLNVLKECKEHAFNETKYNLTLSLGLVLAHAHFPIYAMHDLAAALLKNAKKIGGSALDFAVVTASGSRDLDWLRTEVLTDHSFVNPPPQGWHYRLTQRPYQLAKFERLCHHARQLQALRFPRSQLQALYEGLFTSGIEASLRTITVIGRASEKHRRKLLDFFTDFRSSSHDIPPWSEESKKPAKLDDQPQEQHFSTALGDLIELYRFVIALAEGDEHASNH